MSVKPSKSCTLLWCVCMRVCVCVCVKCTSGLLVSDERFYLEAVKVLPYMVVELLVTVKIFKG